MTNVKKILFIGDSQTGMVKNALSADPALDALGDFDFFVQASKADTNLGGLECRDGHCAAPSRRKGQPHKTASGAGGFRPDDFDAIVLVGLRTELPYTLWNGFCWGDMGEVAGKQYIGEEIYRKALHDVIVEQSIAMSVAREIRSVSDCRILLVPNPYNDAQLRCVEINAAPGIISDRKVTAAQITNEAEVLADWKSAMDAAFGDLNVEILYQAEATTVDTIFSRAEFSWADRTPPDYRHMTEKFGRLVVEQVLETF